ncbi:TPA: hypothetical protein ACF8KN_004079 [Salmonella enterica]
MATYGALLTTPDGVQFVTPNTTPIALEKKLTATGSGIATITTTFNTEDVVMPFCCTTGAEAYFTYTISGNTISVQARQTVGQSQSLTLHLYLFTTKAQVPPAWGMAIWDKNGKCILTNETKILTDITTGGIVGEVNSGVNLDITTTGKKAIAPQAAGFMVAVSSGGALQSPIGNTCYFNGASSRMRTMLAETPPTGWNRQVIDFKTSVKYIDASYYD